MHRPLPKAPGCFNWGPAYTIVLIPRRFYVIRLFVIAARETYTTPIGRNTGNSLTRGGQQKRQKQQLCLLWPALQPKQLCFALAAHMRLVRPTKREPPCGKAWLWIEGHSAGSIVSLAYLDHLIGASIYAVLTDPRPGHLGWLGTVLYENASNPFRIWNAAAIGQRDIPLGCRQSPTVAPVDRGQWQWWTGQYLVPPMRSSKSIMLCTVI